MQFVSSLTRQYKPKNDVRPSSRAKPWVGVVQETSSQRLSSCVSRAHENLRMLNLLSAACVSVLVRPCLCYEERIDRTGERAYRTRTCRVSQSHWRQRARAWAWCVHAVIRTKGGCGHLVVAAGSCTPLWTLSSTPHADPCLSSGGASLGDIKQTLTQRRVGPPLPPSNNVKAFQSFASTRRTPNAL